MWQKNITMGDGEGHGEMTKQLRALAALPEDLGLIPRIHMVAHKSGPPVLRDLITSSGP